MYCFYGWVWARIQGYSYTNILIYYWQALW